MNGMENNSDVKSKSFKSDFIENEREKAVILKDLNDLKKTYDEIIIQNKTMSLQLIEERDKVIELMTELVASKDNKNSFGKYRTGVKSLQDKLKLVSVENAKLKEQNISIIKQNGLIKEQNKITEMGLKDAQTNSEKLKSDLINTVEKLSKLDVNGTTVVTYKLKNSGELIVTDKANKVDGINVSFVIAKNENAKPAEKIYYIQVINSENIVLGDVNKGVHQYKSLTYSFSTNVNYDKKLIHVSDNFLGNKFTKGTYYVNVYDKEELVDESTFSLK